jgi:DNA-binding MarR family transcriptional regulator
MNEKRGYAWPSLPHIAEELRIDKSTVVRSINRLERHGWITVEHRCGRQRGNRYRLAIGALEIGKDGMSFKG